MHSQCTYITSLILNSNNPFYEHAYVPKTKSSLVVIHNSVDDQLRQ